MYELQWCKMQKPELSDIQGISDIRQFVDGFYLRIQKDRVLGLVFNQILRVDWDSHLELMYRFWDTVLFGSGTYKGNPLVAHQSVNQKVSQSRGRVLASKDFEQWIRIFRDTLDESFAGPNTERAKRSAERMASHLETVCARDYQEGPMRLVPYNRRGRESVCSIDGS